jgi:hypothetical protein
MAERSPTSCAETWSVKERRVHVTEITANTVLEGLEEVPVMDVHTHLTGNQLGARGLHDILLYHMVISDLYSAGCPSGDRLTQHPGEPSSEEKSARIVEAIPYLAYARNTSNQWGLRTILKDLYGWSQPITLDNWQELDGLVLDHAKDSAWPRQILDRLHIARTATEYARRGDGSDDDRLQYSVEWGMFTRRQWGEFDTPLYELERCWGQPLGSPAPIGPGTREKVERPITTVADVHAALDHFVAELPSDALTLNSSVSTEIDYYVPTDEQMEAALHRRAVAGEQELNTYASYLNEHLLSRLERREPHIVFLYGVAAEPMPFETATRLEQRTLRQLAEMAERHPGVEFLCLNASRHGNQGLCSIARELQNFSLTGYWWHNFYPGAIRQIAEERLDMVPSNRHMAFFSDAYSVEWTYAKLCIIRRQLAEVFALKIRQGQYTVDEALAIARDVLYVTPQKVLGMRPHSSFAG